MAVRPTTDVIVRYTSTSLSRFARANVTLLFLSLEQFRDWRSWPLARRSVLEILRLPWWKGWFLLWGLLTNLDIKCSIPYRWFAHSAGEMHLCTVSELLFSPKRIKSTSSRILATVMSHFSIVHKEKDIKRVNVGVTNRKTSVRRISTYLWACAESMPPDREWYSCLNRYDKLFEWGDYTWCVETWRSCCGTTKIVGCITVDRM